MKSVETESRLAHVLVCVNDRGDDSELPCCGDGGQKVYELFSDWIEAQSLLSRMWLTKTECLGWCHTDGATVVFYPDDIWYRAVSPRDCSALIERHLKPLVDGGDP